MFIDVAEVQQRLPEILEKMVSGESVHITQDGRSVARLVRLRRPSTEPIRIGGGEGTIIINEDVPDDAHLEHFKEYMP